MRSTNADLGVPVPERRRGRRILTLRNVGWAALAGVIIVAGLNIRSEMQDPTDGEYGRLYGREINKTPEVTPGVVVESSVAPVDEAASADPFSLEAAQREQYLGRPTLEPVPLLDPITTSVEPTATTTDASNVRVVGGPEGVTLVQEQARPAPPLGGGFGRKP